MRILRSKAERGFKFLRKMWDKGKKEAGRTEMGRRARTIAEEQFDRPQSYKKIIELIEELTGNE